ncbi:hypothetical protein [Luteibacter sp.]|uniref:hypothetical protein n=1 Tax=Luteibacter sp. TaxID=1886636 RepID=UPI003F7D7544
MNLVRNALGAVAAMLLAGCSLHANSVRMDPPSVAIPTESKPVVIGSVYDKRDMALLPESSRERVSLATSGELGKAGVASSVAGGGKFIWTLTDNDTVTDWVRDLVITGLRQNGFRAVKASEAAPGTPVIDIDVNEFWAYIPFNFGRSLTYTQQMKAWIATTVHLNSGAEPASFKVRGEGAHIVQIFSEENVRQAYELASDDYLKNFQRKASEL